MSIFTCHVVQVRVRDCNPRLLTYIEPYVFSTFCSYISGVISFYLFVSRGWNPIITPMDVMMFWMHVAQFIYNVISPIELILLTDTIQLYGILVFTFLLFYLCAPAGISYTHVVLQ